MNTKYEDIEDDDKHIANYVGNLLIDAKNDILKLESIYTKSEQYHISINQLQSFETLKIVNTLANNAFQHQIILINKAIFFIIPAFFIFNLFLYSHYNSTELKDLVINSGSSNQSTSGTSQLK